MATDVIRVIQYPVNVVRVITAGPQGVAGTGLDTLTTKGDALGHNGTVAVRVPVGTDGQVFTADSTAPAGVKWATITTTPAWADITGKPSTFPPEAHTHNGDTLTPAALRPSSELQLPTNAPGTPTAGDIYRVTNTLRYRDGSNVERLLLNATDNLANLASPATALLNLGVLAAFRNASVLSPSSDATVISTVTPANVAGMSFSVTANTSYAILFLGNITHGGNGFDVRVDFPSLFNMGSGVAGWGLGVLASGVVGNIQGVSSTNVRLGTRGGAASTQQMFALGIVTVAATGGTANFQFCQNSSGATNSTLLASSRALILPL